MAAATGPFALAQAPLLECHPVSQRAAEGSRAAFRVTLDPLENQPVSIQWMKDGIPLAGRLGNDLVLENVGAEDMGDYHAVLTSPNGVTHSRAAKLRVIKPPTAFGSIDRGFHLARSTVASIRVVVPVGGKFLIGGAFSEINGETVHNLARIDANGILDTTFNPGGPGPDGEVRAILPLSDGIYVGGDFQAYNGDSKPYLIRISEDGVLDTGFARDIQPDGPIHTLARLPGRVLAGGDFRTYDGNETLGLLCILENGVFDPHFAGHSHFDISLKKKDNGIVNVLKIDEQNRILVGGDFIPSLSIPSGNLTRLLPGGGLDPDFHEGIGPNLEVHSIEITYSRDIMIGGRFSRIHSHPPRNKHLARLGPDGGYDDSFGGHPNGNVHAIVSESDGSMIVAGDFTAMDGAVIAGIARLEQNGDLDTDFQPPLVNNIVRTLVKAGSHQMVAGGDFSVPHRGILRFHPSMPPQEVPAMVRQPESQSLTEGSTMHLSVSVTGLSSPTYYWSLNGKQRFETAHPELAIPSATVADAGRYTVRATDGNKSVISGPADISVIPPAPGVGRVFTYAATRKDMKDSGITESRIHVSEQFPVQEVRVRIYIRHIDNEELEATLIGPNGLRVGLFDHTPRRGKHFAGTGFADCSPVQISSDASPYYGTYASAAPLYNFVFANTLSTGVWTLEVDDRGPDDGRIGTIDTWHLELTAPPTPVTYANWQAHFFHSSQPEQEPDDDYNRDGFPNLASFAFASDPAKFLVPLRLVSGEGGRMMRHRRWHAPAGIGHWYEVSSDLSTWRTATPGDDFVIDHVQDLGTGVEEVMLLFTTAENYARMRYGLTD